MGDRWLKSEESEIVDHYPTASPAEMVLRIPERTWAQICVHARRMRVLRTTEARGNSIREGRKALKHAWSEKDNKRFDTMYPINTRAQLRAAFSSRTWKSIQSHAQKRHLHRTRGAAGKQINNGRSAAKEEQKDKNAQT
jgi:hypothetical protein